MHVGHASSAGLPQPGVAQICGVDPPVSPATSLAPSALLLLAFASSDDDILSFYAPMESYHTQPQGFFTAVKVFQNISKVIL